MDYITVSDLVFFAKHGVYDAEKQLGQKFYIDLRCGVDLSVAGKSDRCFETVNYAEMFEVIRQIVEQENFDLIEKLACEVIKALFAFDSRIMSLWVRVSKPGAPTGYATGLVGVEIERQRKDVSKM